MKLYSFDYIRLCSPITKNQLDLLVKYPEIKKLFIKRKIICDPIAYNDITSLWYKTRIHGRPSSNHVLKTIFAFMDKQNITLTYIEITYDQFYRSKKDAINDYSEYIEPLYLAHINPKLNFFQSEPNEKFFDGRFLAIGRGNSFQFATYLRRDKDYPEFLLLRKEFRIATNKRILKSLGINHESEITNPEIAYEILEKKYLRSGKLNQNKIKHLMKHREQPIEFIMSSAFREFLRNERKYSDENESRRYHKKLNKPFCYFIK